ncbi:MAG: hypothetical protein Q8O54_08445, partial [Brevundimonas sp.]|nr:hypothetical protein [Brevundimonas sp.]
MRVGVPTEIKKNEHRIGLTPTAVREYVAHGHSVSVQQGAGVGAGFTDEDYQKVGAAIVPTAAEIFANNDMIVKVKEPQKVEWEMLREDQILFTYLHLAPDPDQTRGLLASKCAAIAYETVTDDRKGLPLLALGADAALKELAAKELKNPESVEEQLAVADAWWDAAEKAAGQERDAMRFHAGSWYQEV